MFLEIDSISINEDMKPYILNDINMQNYLKYNNEKSNTLTKNDFFNLTKDKKINTQQDNHNDTQQDKHPIVENNKKQNDFFIPKEKDTLFWCYYLIVNGFSSYEMLNVRNELVTKQIKIDLVQLLRSNKPILKIYKYDSLINIENNLVNENFVNIKTIMTLFAVHKINVVFIKSKTYYELMLSDNLPIYIIRESSIESKYVKKYGFEIANENSLEVIHSTLYKIDKLEKPIKALSSYKVQDLMDICKKINIETTNTDKHKSKTKNELYELLVQYFS